jgi:hypothetical protein
MKQNVSSPDALQATHPAIITTSQSHSCMALHKFVNQAIAGLPMQPIPQTGLIANNVQQELLVSTDKAILGTIVSSLLLTVLIHSKGAVIKVSAKLIGNITVMHIKTKDTGQMEVIAEGFHKLQPMAQSVGGCITISNGKFHGINLAITFINQ